MILFAVFFYVRYAVSYHDLKEIMQDPRRGRLNVVCADNVAGGRVAAQRFIEAGHTRFGFVGGPETASTTQERGSGFTAELEEAGIQVEAVVHATEYSYEAGTEAARRLLTAGVRPEAVFCASDMLAFGLLDVARHEFGISIPDELSVIGFDDVGLAASASYRLTTIRQPIATMVSDTVDILVRRLDNWAEDCEAVLCPASTSIVQLSLRKRDSRKGIGNYEHGQ